MCIHGQRGYGQLRGDHRFPWSRSIKVDWAKGVDVDGVVTDELNLAEHALAMVTRCRVLVDVNPAGCRKGTLWRSRRYRQRSSLQFLRYLHHCPGFIRVGGGVVVNKVWSGRFDRLADAQEHASGASQDRLFADAQWLRRQEQLWSDLSSAPESLDDLLGARGTTLPLLIAEAESVSVIDLGGGSGWCYRASLSVGARFTSYTVVEIPPVVEAYSPMSNDELRWVTSEQLAAAVHVADVLYVNSALQYMPDNETLLSTLDATGARTVLLDQLLWTRRGADWFTVQVNSDVPTVARFTAVEPLMSALVERGLIPCWANVLRGTSSFNFPDMSEFDALDRIPGYLSLLFRRR